MQSNAVSVDMGGLAGCEDHPPALGFAIPGVTGKLGPGAEGLSIFGLLGGMRILYSRGWVSRTISRREITKQEGTSLMPELYGSRSTTQHLEILGPIPGCWDENAEETDLHSCLI